MRWRRVSSRRRRRSRLRSTIVRLNRGTTIPTRAYESGEAVVRTSRCSLRNRLPSCLTRSMSAFRVSRERRGKTRRPLGPGVLRRQPNGQLLTTLLPATAKNRTPPFRRHTCTEPVLANTALVARTVGGLSHDGLALDVLVLRGAKPNCRREIRQGVENLLERSTSLIDFSTWAV